MRQKLESLIKVYHLLYDDRVTDESLFKKAVFLIREILAMMDENISIEYKVYFKEVALAVLCMDNYEIDEIFRNQLYDEVSALVYDIKTMDDVIKNAVLPKICPKLVISNKLYESAQELFVDFKKYITRRSAVAIKMRVRVYSYMYFIAKEVLSQMETFEILPKDCDEEVLVWMLRQVLRTKQFEEAFILVDNEVKVNNQREEAVYLKLCFYSNL